MTINDLYTQLNRNGYRTPIGTIYRTMRMLCEVGFAQHRYFGEETHYDNVSDKTAHDHLICTVCGHIVEFHDPVIEGLRQDIAAANGFTLTVQHLEIYGRCSACRPRAESADIA